MAKFHINFEGNPGRCSAQPGNCKFAVDDEEQGHYASKKEARLAFEKRNELPNRAQAAAEKIKHNYIKEDYERFAPLIKIIDERNMEFSTDDIRYDDIAKLYTLANELSPSDQKFADRCINKWYRDKKRKITEIYDEKGNFNFRKDGSGKRHNEESVTPEIKKAAGSIAKVYDDIDGNNHSEDKEVIDFLSRNSANYKNVAEAIKMTDILGGREQITYRSHLVNRTEGFKQFSNNDLRTISHLHPAAAIELIERKNESSPTTINDIDNAYEYYSSSENKVSSAFRNAKLKLFKTVLENSDLRSGDGVSEYRYIDASKKLNTEYGLSATEFAKIMEKDFKKYKPKDEASRITIKEIIDNIRKHQK